MHSVGVSTTSPHPLLRGIFFGGIFLVLLLALTGFLYENITEARDRRFNPMPGQLVTVNGRKMHIDCSGQGSPAVVLDSGLGDSFISWRKVQPDIAKFTRVCSYDRAGLGYSEPGSSPRNSQVFAEELHQLLQAANVPAPYVLVGHSMAGFDIRLFTSLYRNEVAGLVFVDASHPDQESRLPAELKNMEGSWLREAEFLEYTTPFGIPRLMGLCDESAAARAATCNWQNARQGIVEMKAFSSSAALTAKTGPFGDIPLAVLSHDPDKPLSELPPDLAKPTNEAWAKMQEELAHLSSRGTRQIVKNSAHYIQQDRPDAVIDAIQRVVNEVREPQATPVPATR
jgi:pimeloyl-ACP methyl ester carboxylesterase